MAKADEKTEATADKKEKPAKKKGNLKNSLIMAFALIAAIIFLPTTVMLVVGMIPTIVAVLIDRSPKHTLGMTIGAMNFAGCVPFILQLWRTGHDFDTSFYMLSDPKTIIVMYASAGMAYALNWAMTGIVSAVMVQKAKFRVDAIEKTLLKIEDRWGNEVKSRTK